MRSPLLVAASILAVTLGACADDHSASTAPKTIRRPSQAFVSPAAWSITPTGSTLAIGATKQFQVFALDSKGVVLSELTASTWARWASTNPLVATVSAGLVTARAAGTTTISWVDDEGHTVRAAITVPAPAITTAPTTGGTIPTTSTPGGLPTGMYLPASTWTNQPAGFALIAERPFNSKAATLNDVTGAEGWNTFESTAPALTIVGDATSPVSRGSVLQMLYPAGFAGGSSAGPFAKDFPDKKEVYVSVWVKLSANFQGHGSNTNKMFFLWMNRNTNFFISAEGKGSGPLQPQLRLQSTPDARTHFSPNLAPGATVPRGVWQRWEFVVKMNTPGVANGEMRWWINGVKTHEYTNVTFSDATQASTIMRFQAASVWGGTGDVVQQDMTISWDHVYVSGR